MRLPITSSRLSSHKRWVRHPPAIRHLATQMTTNF
jgi:hypothetical protein